MRFSPNHQLHILSEESFTQEIAQVDTALDACRHSGRVTSFDGLELFYEYFLAENSIGTIVIVHGLSEFTKKFYELAWYFLNQGYNVFLYDQRGHGFSGRLTDSLPLIHVEHFDDYVRDLDVLLTDVVIPVVGDTPLYLYAHSMGGAVAMLYMAQHPVNPIAKTVLSAPLIRPQTGKMPLWMLRSFARLEALAVGKNARSCKAGDFDPNVRFSPRISDLSAARFERNLAFRRHAVHYQSTPQTTGWNCEALALRKRLLSRKTTRAIQTPTLLLCAEKDTIVCNREQQLFADRTAACRMHIINNAKHSLFTGNETILTEMLTQTLTFYRES